MKNLLLFFCLVLCFSCRSLEGDCIPIFPGDLLFNSQEGIDSTTNHDGYQLLLTGVQEEKCESIKPEKIECSWFSAEIASNNSIIVSVKQNNTSRKKYERLYVKGNDGGTGECSKNSGWFRIYQCPPYDSIKPSKEELLFSAEGGIESVIISNAGSSRSYLELSGSGISESNPPRIYIEEGSLLAESWFTITASDEKTIVFSVTKNETGKERNLVAKIVDTDICSSSNNVKIIQSAE